MPIATERNGGSLCSVLLVSRTSHWRQQNPFPVVTGGDKKNFASLLSAMGVLVSFRAIPAIEMFPLAARIFVECETPPIFFSAFSSSFSGTVLASQRVIVLVNFGRAALQKHIHFNVADSLLHSHT